MIWFYVCVETAERPYELTRPTYLQMMSQRKKLNATKMDFFSTFIYVGKNLNITYACSLWKNLIMHKIYST